MISELLTSAKSAFIHNRIHYHSAFGFDIDSSSFRNSQDGSREISAEEGQADEEAKGRGAGIRSAKEPPSGRWKTGEGRIACQVPPRSESRLMVIYTVGTGAGKLRDRSDCTGDSLRWSEELWQLDQLRQHNNNDDNQQWLQ